MEFPILKPNQYALIHAEVKTGHVLLLNGKLHLGSGEAWLIFNSLNEAMEYAEKKVLDSPEIECGIFNHLNERVALKYNEMP
jgi:hypothetical protein